MNRSLVFAALLAGVGLGAWSSHSGPLTPPGLDFGALAASLQHYLGPRPFEAPASVSAAVVDEHPQTILLNAAMTVEEEPVLPAANSAANLEQATAPAACGAWDISEHGMEAVIQEMFRQGWTPPSRADALALSQPVGRAPIEAIDPDLPALPVSNPEDRSGASSDEPRVIGH